jgi:heterodisulfide reductase subunit D
MTALILQYIDRCIACHQCMDICPVTKGSFTIEELNTASKKETSVPETIKEFAFNCVQCGKCVPVCPMNIRRDYMVRYIKHKLREQKPKSYTRYLLIKGSNKTGFPRIIQKLFIVIKKIITRDLACFMETNPSNKVDVLFYPGCYIYSTKIIRQTLRLLDHIGCSYAVLGGVTSCCGMPHRLQGEFEQADHCLEVLHQKLRTIEPKIIITACAECFEAVEQLKTTYDERYEVLNVVQYLLRHMKKFPQVKIRGKIMVHESCRFNKESSQGSAACDIASTFGELIEHLANQASSCCYQWNHGNDPGNVQRLTVYLSAVKNVASTLACNCVTCYEELKKAHTDVEIIDILQLFEEALHNIQKKEGKR